MHRIFLTAAEAGSLEGLINSGKTLMAFLLESAGEWLDFVIERPILLSGFLLTLVGAGIGFLVRIWHSA